MVGKLRGGVQKKLIMKNHKEAHEKEEEMMEYHPALHTSALLGTALIFLCNFGKKKYSKITQPKHYTRNVLPYADTCLTKNLSSMSYRRFPH